MRAICFLLFMSFTGALAQDMTSEPRKLAKAPESSKPLPGIDHAILVRQVKSPEERADDARDAAERTKNLELQQKQLDAARDAVKSAERSADIADRALIVTIVVGGIALWQLIMFGKQLKGMRETIDATKAAIIHAEKQSMPVLLPRIKSTAQGSVADIIYLSKFKPIVFFVFENYGETPGVILEVRSILTLMSKDSEFPDVVENDKWIYSHNTTIVPGGYRMNSSDLDPIEFACPMDTDVIRANLDDKTFFLYGQVMYDDIFGVRHVRGFGRRFRYFSPSTQFSQRIRGDDRFEYYMRHDRKTSSDYPHPTSDKGN